MDAPGIGLQELEERVQVFGLVARRDQPVDKPAATLVREHDGLDVSGCSRERISGQAQK
ncbi:MAG: hypothetical protein HY892_05500 [Deltaproteobacteria bacterium]|nr:hypothetical protein [Deltaproteobacteria bacterium]